MEGDDEEFTLGYNPYEGANCFHARLATFGYSADGNGDSSSGSRGGSEGSMEPPFKHKLVPS